MTISMNKTIEELAKDAEVYYCKETEDFAYRIVEECINAIREWRDSNVPFAFDEDAAILLLRNRFKP